MTFAYNYLQLKYLKIYFLWIDLYCGWDETNPGNKLPLQGARMSKNDWGSKLVSMDTFYTVYSLNQNKMDTFDPLFVFPVIIALAGDFCEIDNNTYFIHKL